jgi:hypothetical protein
LVFKTISRHHIFLIKKSGLDRPLLLYHKSIYDSYFLGFAVFKLPPSEVFAIGAFVGGLENFGLEDAGFGVCGLGAEVFAIGAFVGGLENFGFAAAFTGLGSVASMILLSARYIAAFLLSSSILNS